MKRLLLAIVVMALPLHSWCQKSEIAALKKCADKGSQECVVSLASYYASQQQYAKAYELLKKHENPENQYYMSYLILHGEVKKQGLEQALVLLNQSANSGFTPALKQLGNIYLTDEYGVQNYTVAMGYYRRLAEAGDAEGLYLQALVHLRKQDTLQALDLLRQAADGGNGSAWADLGRFYMKGRHLPADTAEAYHCFQRASECGIADGDYLMGLMHLKGVGCERDTLAALPHLLEAARYGVGPACGFVGGCFEEGLYGMEQSLDSAIYYYKLGSLEDDPRSDYSLGAMLYAEGNPKCFNFLQSAASYGHTEAELLAGECVMRGLGVECDPEAAYALFENVARRTSHPMAYIKMGYYRLWGIGCERNLELTKLYFDTAALLGDPDGIYNVGICYLGGIGCEQDTAMGISCLERAAQQGCLDAVRELGNLYEANGDYAKAVPYFEQGVALGDEESMCDLGLCYEEGNGVILNTRRAFELYSQAAEEGSIRGMYFVGMCYVEAVYVSDNLEQAVIWLGLAADRGHVLSCYVLGMMYLHGAQDSSGQRLAPDKKKAKRYLSMAAEEGFEPAAAALKKK